MPGGKGWAACTRVRLLHAKVRRRLLARGGGGRGGGGSGGGGGGNGGGVSGASSWPLEELGIPINQADLSATLLAFSICVLLGMLNAGIDVSEEDARDVVAWWRWAGHLMGVDDDTNPCVDLDSARSAIEMVALHVLKPDAGSQVRLCCWS